MMQDETIAKACQALLAATTIPQAATPLVEAVRAFANPDRVLVLIKDAKGDAISPAGAHGYEATATPPHTAPFSEFVMTSRKPLLLHKDQAHALWQHRAPDVQSMLCLPISHHSHVMGALILESTTEHRFTEAHQQSVEAVLAPVTLALESLVLTRAIRTMEHDLRNALGAANLLLFQVLGSENESSESYVASLKDTDSAELATLGTLAETINDPAERDNYIAHLQQLATNRNVLNEILGGVRTAVNRALAITGNLEGHEDATGSRFNQKAMKSRLRSSR